MEKAKLSVTAGPVIKMSITGGPVIRALFGGSPVLKFNIGKTLYIFDTSFSNLTGSPLDNQSLVDYINIINASGVSSTTFQQLKEYLISNTTINNSTDARSLLISGSIMWKSGLTYTSTDIAYQILGVKYTAQSKDITLTPADPNLSRMDTFYVDTFGNLQEKTGIPAINPASPVLNSTQLEVMTVLIAPGALVPSNVDVELVYDENTEWSTSEVHDTNISVDFDSVIEPLNGTKRIKVAIAIPDTETNSPLHYIGEKYQGGIIFWISADGKSGLICSAVDAANGVFWASLSGGGQSAGSDGTAIGTGQSNTAKMLLQAKTLGHAVKYCDELIIDGFNDWFMPSKDELLAMYFRRFEIGGFANKMYWSSTEYNYKRGISVSFANGVADYWDKNRAFDVRAIRAFNDAALPTNQPVPSYVPTNTILTFSAGTPVTVQDGILSMNIKSSLPWLYNSMLVVESYLEGVKTGTVAISPSTGQFGYNSENDAWRMIALQMYQFAPSATTLDSFKISLVGSWPNNIDLGFDDIRFQHTGIILAPDKPKNTFIGLEDTPSSYTAQALKVLRVKEDETGVEFVIPTSTNESIQYLSGLNPIWDITLGIHAAIMLSGNTTITMVNVTGGKSGNLTVINAPAVYTLTFAGNTNKISPAIYKADNQVITSGLGLRDVFSYYYDDWTLLWNGTNGYKP